VDYKASGVDIDAGNETVRRIRALARSTFTPGVISDIGSFGGLFQLEPGRYREPVLVSSADGVGTKLKLAFLTNRHNTVGIDLVNHCVNDILVQGAEPLFFLDYLATGRLSPDVAQSVIDGIASACRDNGCALLGGETAEMPGFYNDGEYDLAGFIVGVVDRPRLINGRAVAVGDRLVGLPSSGLHTNGYSLARQIVFEQMKLQVDSRVPELGRTVGEALLEPHRSYLQMIRPLLDGGRIKAMAHITGGGITENLPRVLPHGTAAVVDASAWEVPPLFRWLQRNGSVPIEDMMRTFNMGMGLVIVAPRDRAETLIEELAARGGRDARVIGEVPSPRRADFRPREQPAGADRRHAGRPARCRDRGRDFKPRGCGGSRPRAPRRDRGDLHQPPRVAVA
jgi:phosphoribosylformylglycinamidine cyclo-ligase